MVAHSSSTICPFDSVLRLVRTSLSDVDLSNQFTITPDLKLPHRNILAHQQRNTKCSAKVKRRKNVRRFPLLDHHSSFFAAPSFFSLYKRSVSRIPDLVGALPHSCPLSILNSDSVVIEFGHVLKSLSLKFFLLFRARQMA